MTSRERFCQQARHVVESAIGCGVEKSVIQSIAAANCHAKQASVPMGNIANPFSMRQSGVVLVISLIMLLLLTLIGVSGMQSTILEEKMAGNMRDRNMAFQAAEAALKDAERHIIDRGISGFTEFSTLCGAATPKITDNGLCDNRASGSALTNVADNNVWDVTRSVQYGDRTNARKIGDTDGDGEGDDITPRLSAQPRYIIDAVQATPGHVCNGAKPCYRITARAQGVNANTVVVLQTIFMPS